MYAGPKLHQTTSQQEEKSLFIFGYRTAPKERLTCWHTRPPSLSPHINIVFFNSQTLHNNNYLNMVDDDKKYFNSSNSKKFSKIIPCYFGLKKQVQCVWPQACWQCGHPHRSIYVYNTRQQLSSWIWLPKRNW